MKQIRPTVSEEFTDKQTNKQTDRGPTAIIIQMCHHFPAYMINIVANLQPNFSPWLVFPTNQGLNDGNFIQLSINDVYHYDFKNHILYLTISKIAKTPQLGNEIDSTSLIFFYTNNNEIFTCIRLRDQYNLNRFHVPFGCICYITVHIV